MNKSVLCFLLVLVVSCNETHTNITGYNSAGLPLGTFDTIQRVYGKLNAESTLFGVTHSGNLDIGFGKLMQMAGMVGTMSLTALMNYHKALVDIAANGNLSKEHLAQIAAIDHQVTARIQAQGGLVHDAIIASPGTAVVPPLNAP